MAGNDDVASDRTSSVTFPARAGETYQIAIDGFNEGYDVETGEVWLSWNLGAAPADVTPPETTIVEAPPAGGTDTRARLRFASSEPASTFECRIGSGPWHTCWPGAEYVPVSGALVFEVRATDDAANTDPTPARHAWVVDDEAPETTLTRGPAAVTADAEPAFEFSSSDPSASFECWIDGGPWTPCTSPHHFAPLGDGLHDVRIRAVDALGNPDSSPEDRTFSIEGGVTPLDTTITAGPDDPSGADASFAFTSTRGDGFQCRLDAGDWHGCTSPVRLVGLAGGRHTFSVRAVDGPDVDPTPASHTWTVDVTPPETSPGEPDPPPSAPGGTPQPGQPSGPAGPTAPTLDPPDILAPALERPRLRVGRTQIVLRLRASEPARLLLRLERRIGDRFRRSRTFEVALDAGANVIRLRARLRPGRYRLRGTALDAAGNRRPFGPLPITVRRP